MFRILTLSVKFQPNIKGKSLYITSSIFLIRQLNFNGYGKMIAKNFIILEGLRKEFNQGTEEICKVCGDKLTEATCYSMENRLCKFCQRKRSKREYIKKYYEQKGVKYWVNWYRKLREELFNALGNKCEKCGYDWRDEGHSMKVFDIHHVDRSSKKKSERMSSGHLTKKQVKKLIRLHKEGKVKLLCCRCHREEELISSHS